jgi:hypothetical protein
MSSNTPKEIDFAASILILGSGFSQSAINISGQQLLTGTGLRSEFATLLGVGPNEYDLKTLADEIASRPDLSLYQTLYKLFTVKKLQEAQTEVLSKSWLRVYTTNYDDAVEFAYHGNRNAAPSYSYDDPKPKRLEKTQLCIFTG